MLLARIETGRGIAGSSLGACDDDGAMDAALAKNCDLAGGGPALLCARGMKSRLRRVPWGAALFGGEYTLGALLEGSRLS